MPALPPWAGRVAALTLLIAVLAAVYALTVMPLRSAYSETRAQLAEQHELLARYRAIAERRPEMRDRVRTLRRRQADSGLFLSGETDALAAAALQDRISATAQGAGGDVRSMQGQEPKQEDGLTRVGMNVQVVADIRSLRDLLYQLETGRPLLFVEDLEVRGRLRRTDDDGTEIAPDLLIKLSVIGYRLGEAT